MNAERADARTTGLTEVTLKQFAAEFAHQRRGLFDPVRGRVEPFAASYAGVWHNCRSLLRRCMTQMALRIGTSSVVLVPKPLWWLMGAIVSFYF